MHRNPACKLWCAGKVKTNSQCRSVFGMASRIHYLNRHAVLSSSANLNLGIISLSRFWSYAQCVQYLTVLFNSYISQQQLVSCCMTSPFLSPKGVTSVHNRHQTKSTKPWSTFFLKHTCYRSVGKKMVASISF